MTAPPEEALARCVGDVAGFLDRHWATSPHLWAGADAGGFGDLLPLSAVDHVLATTSPRTPSFRLVKDGRPLPPASYTRSGRVGGRPYEGAADVGRLYQAFADGATIVLQSLHRSWAPLARFCRDLELSLTQPTQANAYLTPAGATALAPPPDTHDVLVLQVPGHKHWRVSTPVVESPLPRHHSRHERAAAQPLLFEADLAPGDCLYLPRGFVHAATAQQGTSLHVTIGIHATTAHDVLAAMMDRAADHPAFRAALPVGFAGDDNDKVLVDAVEACVAEARRWLSSLDTEAVAEDLRRRFWSQRTPLLEGQLQQLVGLGELDDDSLVRRRPRSTCRLRLDGDRLRLVSGDRALLLPAAVEPAVRRLLHDVPQPVSALGDLLDPSSRMVLVRRLVREGILVAERVGGGGVSESRGGAGDLG